MRNFAGKKNNNYLKAAGEKKQWFGMIGGELRLNIETPQLKIMQDNSKWKEEINCSRLVNLGTLVNPYGQSTASVSKDQMTLLADSPLPLLVLDLC